MLRPRSSPSFASAGLTSKKGRLRPPLPTRLCACAFGLPARRVEERRRTATEQPKMAAGCVSRWLAEAATAAGSCRTGGGEPRRLALVLGLARWRNVAPVASRVAMAPRMGNRFGKRPGNKRASEDEQSAASPPPLLV